MVNVKLVGFVYYVNPIFVMRLCDHTPHMGRSMACAIRSAIVMHCSTLSFNCSMLIAHSFPSGRACGTPGYILRMKRLPGVSILLDNCNLIAQCSLLIYSQLMPPRSVTYFITCYSIAHDTWHMAHSKKSLFPNSNL